MLTDKGDDGDTEKSDELEAIDCLTRFQKDNFETTRWEMAQCCITMLKGCLRNSMGGNFNFNVEAENQGIGLARPLPTILRLFNTVKEQLAVCA